MSSPIRIVQAELYRSRIKLKEPFVISLGPLEYAENIIVILKTNTGISGIGECSPFRTIHGETIDTGIVIGKEIARTLLGNDPLDVEACHYCMDRNIYSNNSIKSAFDIALYDIIGKIRSVPVYQLLGGNCIRELFTDYTVSLGPKAKMISDAIRIKEEGYRYIKIKLGDTAEKDIERIQCMREAVGTEIPFRLDANQGWDFQTAIKVLHAVSTQNIQHCEEPIPRWDFMNLPMLRKQSPVPIMADESCCDHHDAERLIALQACDSINVKLGKSAGIFKAKKIISLAQNANLPVQVGGFLESRIGFTASAHLAQCSPAVHYIDFDTPLMFAEDPVTGGIEYGPNGSVRLPEKPGLGVWIDESYLSRQEKHIID
ncbi:MAG TPA: dipeptide epimerase [Bacteroidia bacterium]|nr:dipeptide epimerase [Bacteroidia bacterium]